MKKRKFLLPVVALSLLCSFGLAACGGGEGGDQSGSSAQSSVQTRITISAEGSKTKLVKGDTVDTVQLTPSVTGVSWSSSKEDVATVSETGLVTAVGAGSTVITASKDGYRAGTINITVELEKIQVTAGGGTELLIGETVTLSANKAGVTWESSDATIASVDGNGVVTANKLGDVTISAKKQGYADGTQAIKVKRPAPTKVLHMEDADHYSADGEWASSGRGPGDTPVYTPSSSSPSDGTCIAYFGAGDKETLTFTSDKACRAELVLTVGYYYSISDLTAVYEVKFNGSPITFETQGYEAEGTSNYTYKGISFGEVTLSNSANNVLEITMKETSDSRYPYMDDLEIYAAEAATINVVLPAAKPDVVIDQQSITVAQNKTFQITSSLTGLSYKSASDAIATVTAAGLVTGVAPGNTSIAVSKDGYKTLRVPVEVTEVEGAFIVSIEGITGEGVTTKTSQNLSGNYTTIINTFEAGSVGTLSFTVANAGQYTMYMKARASGGYNSSNTDVLATCMTLKVNGTVVTSSASVSGNTFTEYLIGDVNFTAAGPATIEITCITSVPGINYFKFIPKA